MHFKTRNILQTKHQVRKSGRKADFQVNSDVRVTHEVQMCDIELKVYKMNLFLKEQNHFLIIVVY